MQKSREKVKIFEYWAEMIDTPDDFTFKRKTFYSLEPQNGDINYFKTNFDTEQIDSNLSNDLLAGYPFKFGVLSITRKRQTHKIHNSLSTLLDFSPDSVFFSEFWDFKLSYHFSHTFSLQMRHHNIKEHHEMFQLNGHQWIFIYDVILHWWTWTWNCFSLSGCGKKFWWDTYRAQMTERDKPYVSHSYCRVEKHKMTQ